MQETCFNHNHNRERKSPRKEIRGDGKLKGKWFSFLNVLLIKLLYKVMSFESPILFLFSLQTNAGFYCLKVSGNCFLWNLIFISIITIEGYKYCYSRDIFIW